MFLSHAELETANGTLQLRGERGRMALCCLKFYTPKEIGLSRARLPNKAHEAECLQMRLPPSGASRASGAIEAQVASGARGQMWGGKWKKSVVGSRMHARCAELSPGTQVPRSRERSLNRKCAARLQSLDVSARRC